MDPEFNYYNLHSLKASQINSGNLIKLESINATGLLSVDPAILRTFSLQILHMIRAAINMVNTWNVLANYTKKGENAYLYMHKGYQEKA